MKVEKQASQELVSSHSYATCISWGINTCSYRWGVLHTELVTGRVCPGWQVWICNSWKLMAKSPHLQKCSGAGWKQSQIPQTKKKRWKKLDPSKNLPEAERTVWPKVKLHVARRCGKPLKQTPSEALFTADYQKCKQGGKPVRNPQMTGFCYSILINNCLRAPKTIPNRRYQPTNFNVHWSQTKSPPCFSYHWLEACLAASNHSITI